MKIKRNRALLVILVIIIVSTAFFLSRYGNVSADSSSRAIDSIETTGSTLKHEKSSGIQGMASDSESVAVSLLKLIGVLILVIIGIYGFLYVLKRMMGARFSGNRSNNLIEVVETSFIAQKKSISLVRFADRAVLVGVSDSGINVLAELNPEETARIMSDLASVKPAAGFKSMLKDARSKISTLNMEKLKGIQIFKKTERPQTA
jgi:flagellar biosynthetic protein FliO